MRYGIVRAVAGSPGCVVITKDEYEAIRLAKKHQLVILGIEDKFDLLLSNYAEYEQALLDLSLNRLVYRGKDFAGFHGDLQLVNRRLVNLLSAARLYFDQVAHDLSGLGDLSTELSATVAEERPNQYRGKLGF